MSLDLLFILLWFIITVISKVHTTTVYTNFVQTMPPYLFHIGNKQPVRVVATFLGAQRAQLRAMSSSSSSSPEDPVPPVAVAPTSAPVPPAAPLLPDATVQQLATAVADLIQSHVATGNPLMSGPTTTTPGSAASHPPPPEAAVLHPSTSSATTPSPWGLSSSGKIFGSNLLFALLIRRPFPTPVSVQVTVPLPQPAVIALLPAY